MDSKLYRFYVTTIGGLEEVVLDDLQAQLKGLEQIRVERGKRHGRILFRYSRSPRQLLKLHSTESTFALLAEIRDVTVGRPGLVHICSRIEKLDIQPAVQLLRACGGLPDTQRFQLSATLQGAHRFTCAELIRSIQKILTEQHGLKPGSGKDLLRLHLRVEGRRALFGLRLKGENRPHSLMEWDGLSSSLAYCLARILGIREEDTVVDPRCGWEGMRAIQQACKPRFLIGCHEDKLHLNALKDFHKSQGVQGIWLSCHIRELPLAKASADCLLSRVEMDSGAVKDKTWLAQLEEFARILHPGGVAAVLVEVPREFAVGLQVAGIPLGIMAGLPIYLKARKYTVFLLERLEQARTAGEAGSIDVEVR